MHQLQLSNLLARDSSMLSLTPVEKIRAKLFDVDQIWVVLWGRNLRDPLFPLGQCIPQLVGHLLDFLWLCRRSLKSFQSVDGARPLTELAVEVKMRRLSQLQLRNLRHCVNPGVPILQKLRSRCSFCPKSKNLLPQRPATGTNPEKACTSSSSLVLNLPLAHVT